MILGNNNNTHHIVYAKRCDIGTRYYVLNVRAKTPEDNSRAHPWWRTSIWYARDGVWRKPRKIDFKINPKRGHSA